MNLLRQKRHFLSTRVTVVVIVHKNTNFIGNNNRFAFRSSSGYKN